MDVHYTMIFTGILAGFAFLSFAGLVGTVLYARASIEHSKKAERIRFTDSLLRDAFKEDTVSAFNEVFGNGSRPQNIAKAQATISKENLRKPMSQREDSVSRYLVSVGKLDNMLDKASLYAEENIIDERLFFSQYGETLISIYMVLKDILWDRPEGFNPNPRLTQFVTRAFLCYVEESSIWGLGDDDLQFFKAKAEEFYPGRRTAETLRLAQGRRDEMFLRVG